MPDLIHWRCEHDESNIVSLIFDKSGSSTNVLSLEVVDELEQIINSFQDQRINGLVISSGKENGFIAGADVHSFTHIDSIEEAEELISKVQSIFNSLESLPFTTVAIINGFCLGGGLELALSCNYRVAINDPGTRIGLPEILLGIHPGWGGSIRLIEKAGVIQAMKLMLTGKTVDAVKAYKLGIVDKCVPARHAWRAALRQIADKPPVRKSKYANVTRLSLFRTLIASRLKKNVSVRVNREHYPAPYALIDLWRHYGGNRKTMLEEEGKSVARLICTPTAKNLIRVYMLQDQLKSLGNESDFKAGHVHVIGAGIMGGDIAAWCALNGLTVTLQDREAQYIKPAIKRARQLFSTRLKKPHHVRAAMDRLIPDPGGQGIGRADVLIEAIIENLEAKRSLFQSVQSKLMPGAILATNTSSIPLDELSAGLEKPDRLIGLHFFNPVAKMQLVEVVHHKTTAPEMLQSAARFCRQINRLPLPVKSSPGFLINRILMPYLLEAITLLEEGEQAENIDACAREFGMPVGPVELSDTVGLDICFSVAKILSTALHARVPDILKHKVEQGQLGRKSGSGFYQYRNGRRVGSKTEMSKIPREDITDRLVFSMCNEAMKCWSEKIVTDAAYIDAGMIFGAGFAPFRGGPLHYLESLDRDTLKSRFGELNDNYGDRFVLGNDW